MSHKAAIAICLVFAGCATDGAESEDFVFHQSVPTQSGKSDEAVACGTESCVQELCGYDASVAGQQATPSCAATDGRESTFVAGTVDGTSFDSRTNPYVPVVSLDNVVIYGCELWDYSNQEYDGLQIEYQQLIHASFTVNPNDRARFDTTFGLYVDHFVGPGSYAAGATYQATPETTDYYGGSSSCAVDVAVDAAGTISGTYDCTIPSHANGSIAVTGTFGCAKNSMSPIFSRWAAAPQT